MNMKADFFKCLLSDTLDITTKIYTKEDKSSVNDDGSRH